MILTTKGKKYIYQIQVLDDPHKTNWLTPVKVLDADRIVAAYKAHGLANAIVSILFREAELDGNLNEEEQKALQKE